jgi:hypothetical protein
MCLPVRTHVPAKLSSKGAQGPWRSKSLILCALAICGRSSPLRSPLQSTYFACLGRHHLPSGCHSDILHVWLPRCLLCSAVPCCTDATFASLLFVVQLLPKLLHAEVFEDLTPLLCFTSPETCGYLSSVGKGERHVRLASGQLECLHRAAAHIPGTRGPGGADSCVTLMPRALSFIKGLFTTPKTG